MRRPLVLIAGAFALGIAAEFYMEISESIPVVLLALAVVFGMLFLIHLIYRFYVSGKFSGAGNTMACRLWLLLVFLLFFCCGALDMQNHLNKEDIFKVNAGKDVTFSGTVTQSERKDGERYCITIKGKQGEKILVNIYGDYTAIDSDEPLKNYGDMVGRLVEVSGQIELPSPRRNPHCFDYALYLSTKGIGSICSVKPGDIKLFVPVSGLQSMVYKAANTVAVVRANFIEELLSCMDRQAAGLVIGMVLGDKGELDEDIYEVFQKNGTAHILAVSGIHIGILYMCVNGLTGRRRGVSASIISISVLIAYAAFAMFAPSVVRAVSMIVLHIIAGLFHRRYDMLCAGAGCGAVMLAVNPLLLFNVGFQLSYMAIFVLAVVQPLASYLVRCSIDIRYEKQNLNKGILEKAAEKIIYAFLPGVILQLGMIPITAYNFNYFSPVAFLINAPVIYLAGFTVPLGIMLIPLMHFSGGTVFAGIAVTAEEMLCDLLININEMAFVPKLSYMYVVSPPFWALFCYYGLLFLLTSETAVILWRRSGYHSAARPAALYAASDRARLTRYAALPAAICMVLAAALLSAWAADTGGGAPRSGGGISGVSAAPAVYTISAAEGAESNGPFPGVLRRSFAGPSGWSLSGALRRPDLGKAQITFVDVGQGDCLHIRTPKGKNILIDGGGSSNYDVGKKTLLPYLLKNGVKRLDMVFVTHRHTDHYAGIMSLAHNIDIGNLALYEANSLIEREIMAETGLGEDDIIYLSAGMSVDFEDGVSVEVIAPESRAIDEYESLMREDSDENDISLIMKVNYCGLTVMMTGDIDMDGERSMILGDKDLAADILKVAHHGSRYSSSQEFLEATSPDVAVIQVGKNTFGHPTDEALKRIEQCGADIYRNDKQGAVCIFINNESFEIRTVI